MRQLLGKLRNRVFGGSRGNPYCKISHAQCGEDLILDHLFSWLKIDNPTYLDIGAHHPMYLSNTYYFYQKGCHGVCVEPDPVLFTEIAEKRPNDICLNVGVGVSSQDKAPFYIMTASTLNTFSEEEARRCESYGQVRIEKIMDVPLVSVNEILAVNFAQCPHFVSLDVEGLDLDIVRSFDFAAYRPQVFCIETITYTQNNTEVKIKEIIDYMESKDYFVYADTYINTIFVDRNVWNSRS